MTITSVGYDGTVNEAQWAKLAGYLGHLPCVADSAAWGVTAVVGPDRTVCVATGVGYGFGVMDTSDATVDVQLATISSGTRWDALVARRNWSGAGGATTFTSVAGTSTQGIPAGILTDPGVSADQVLALVQLTAGSSTPSAVVDMRAYPKLGVIYPSTFSLPSTAPVGSTAEVAGRVYVRTVSAWEPATPRTKSGTTSVTFNSSGIATLPFTPALSFTPARIFLTGVLGATGLGYALNTGASLTTGAATIRAWRLTTGAVFVGANTIQWQVVEANA